MDSFSILKPISKKSAIQIANPVPTVVSVHVFPARNSEEIQLKWPSVDIATVGKTVSMLEMAFAASMSLKQSKDTQK
jgi:hypothetical protein